MADDIFRLSLKRFCQRVLEVNGDVSKLRRLSGGANMESWSFDYGDHPLVLRLLPGQGEDGDGVERITIKSEAALVKLAGENGVTAPRMLGSVEAEDNLGHGFLMSRVDGEAMPHKILGVSDYAGALPKLARQCAKELAAIHALPMDELPADVRAFGARELLKQLRERYAQYRAEIPVYDYAFHWLEQHLPSEVMLVPLHGDFRMGNLLINQDGISAVLDWELAHLGDPAQDLAYLCAPSWRFGHYDKSVGGFAEIDELLSEYENAGGENISAKRFQFWLVYSTLWWGVCCLTMTDIWRTGKDRSLERPVIGTRVSEVGIDLLLLLEDEFPDAAAQRISWEPVKPESYVGGSQPSELLQALIDWDKNHVIPNAKGHDLFQARVAGNAMGILKREAELGQAFTKRQTERLSSLGLSFQELRAGLQSAELDLGNGELLKHLRLTAIERLHIDQPKYAGLTVAKNKWSKST